MKKSTLRTLIIEELRRELSRQAAAAELARNEAISEESQPENKWDTHSQEAAYLAEGQARQVTEVKSSLEAYAALSLPDLGAEDPVALGALVELEAAGRRNLYFVGPRSGGLEIEAEGRKVLVVTPSSPLGRQLIGRRLGDLVAPGAGGSQKIIAIT